MIELLKDYVELYPARVLLEVDTFEDYIHSIKHLPLCFKGIEWSPLPLIKLNKYNLNRGI